MKKLLAAAVVLLAAGGGFGYLVITIQSDYAQAQSEITADNAHARAAINADNAQAQAKITALQNKLTSDAATLKAASTADLGYCETNTEITYASGYLQDGTNNLDLLSQGIPFFTTPSLSGGVVSCPSGYFVSVVPQG